MASTRWISALCAGSSKDTNLKKERQRIRRGVFTSVDDLETAITKWVAHRNANPKPFVWTAKPGTLIAKHTRAKKALASVQNGCK